MQPRASLLLRLIPSVSFLRDGLPGSHTVTEEFALDWPQVLSGTHNVALAWVDGRSGVGRGQKTSPVDPRKLGAQRVKDYVGVVESVNVMPRANPVKQLHKKQKNIFNT